MFWLLFLILNLNAKASQLPVASAADSRMLHVTECENHLSSLQQETENDKPQPKCSKREKPSFALC